VLRSSASLPVKRAAVTWCVAAFIGPVDSHLPFAFAVDLQPRRVNDEVLDALARAGGERQVEQAGASGKGRIVRSR
jgi:hypothetical protein